MTRKFLTRAYKNMSGLISAMEKDGFALAMNASHFNDADLKHNISIINGIIQAVRKQVIADEDKLIQKALKGD